MQIEFRDGKREVPDYLGKLMSNLETIRMTYPQAVQEANQRILKDHLNKVQIDVMVGHLKGLR